MMRSCPWCSCSNSRYRSAAKEKNYPANCSPVCIPQENSSCTKIALRQKSAD